MPSDDYVSDTSASLKDIMAALKLGKTSDGAISNDTYDAVERLLYKYEVFIRHGIRENIANHKGVSWFLTADSGRARISYQEGRGDWVDECYADEVPLWLLFGLLRRIQRRKPLGDQEADETMTAVDDLDAEYVQKASTRPHYASYVEDHDDE